MAVSFLEGTGQVLVVDALRPGGEPGDEASIGLAPAGGGGGPAFDPGVQDGNGVVHPGQ